MAGEGGGKARRNSQINGEEGEREGGAFGSRSTPVNLGIVVGIISPTLSRGKKGCRCRGN